MKFVLALAVSALVGGAVATADECLAVGRVRPLDAWAAESFERVSARSPHARRLINRLEASGVIVHVVTAAVMPGGVAGTTRFVARRGGYRYVRVALDRQLLPDSRAAILGHELQHALEIAISDAGDHDAVRELYERIGRRVDRREHFETAAAALAGRRVWSELHDIGGNGWSK